MTVTLIILICHLTACDRIVVPVQTCINAEMQAQVIVAQTDIYQDGDEMIVRCEQGAKHAAH